MKLLAVLLTIGMFSTTSYASVGKKGCGKEYNCKEKKGEEKITCKRAVLTCQKGKLGERFAKLQTFSGKKLEKRKAKHIEKLMTRISRNDERLTKVNSKLSELKTKAEAKKDNAKAVARIQEKIKMKESTLGIINERLNMLKDHKSKIEALN